MRISACQMISGIDPEQNVLDAVNLISASADSGADLVVLPENFALMAGDAANLGIAEAVGEGPIQDAVRMAAMRCGLWVVAGSIPLKGKDATHYTQSSLVFDPEGNIAARYDRIHLFRLQNKTEFYDERIYIEPGKSPVTFRMTTWDGESFSVGLSLGFDLRFPELFRGLSQPDLIVLPATFTEMTGRAHWATLLAARAIENQCFTVGCNACGQAGPIVFGGGSVILDPWGRTLAECGPSEDRCTADCDPRLAAEVRAALPVFADRRPTLYRI